MTTKSDRELLELAAKAAELHLTWGEKYKIGDDEVDCTDMPYAVSDSPDEAPAYWNPLEDDGDALRLAVKLGCSVDIGPDHVYVYDAASRHELWEATAQDPYTATRRAIVRAAAAIGQEKA